MIEALTFLLWTVVGLLILGAAVSVVLCVIALVISLKERDK